MELSSDPKVAQEQMQAVIFYLTTFGYIDGDFDDEERNFVRAQIRRLVEHRARRASEGQKEAEILATIDRYCAHFFRVFEAIDLRVKDLFTEAVSHEEAQDAFVRQTLKIRCFEIFQAFDRPGQEALLAFLDELIMVDGVAHPAELKFRGEMTEFLEADLDFELMDAQEGTAAIAVQAADPPKSALDDHHLFSEAELHYSADPRLIADQIGVDLALMDRAIEVFRDQRHRGEGLLRGKRKVDDLRPGTAGLDGHTYVLMPEPGKTYEVTVLGDLHGCYSVLKAAVLQSGFFDKLKAFKADPRNHPEPKLLFLGDYIDRGKFSFNGVLRGVLRLFLEAPDNVFLLRGNHEYFVEFGGSIYGGVRPAEAISSLKPHVSNEALRAYCRFFEELPNTVLFDRLFFVHGGIPKDRLIKERWRDLSSLNDAEMRFQMMWSDPSSAEVVPASLQEEASRFAFGRFQARAFLERLGCHTLIRGHEKVKDGFLANYDEDYKLFTLFSSGGDTNADLPEESPYREVSPKVLTLRMETLPVSAGATRPMTKVEVVPWEPNWRAFNDPERNGFFRRESELPHIIA
jgi:hypothetical protein